MQETLINIASQFNLEGTIAEIKPLGEGFINDTFVIKTVGDAPNYILQRKNHVIFPDVPGMMENITYCRKARFLPFSRRRQPRGYGILGQGAYQG